MTLILSLVFGCNRSSGVDYSSKEEKVDLTENFKAKSLQTKGDARPER